MDGVGLGATGVPDAAEGVHGGLETALPGGVEVLELDALIGGVGRIFFDEGLASGHGDVTSQGGDPGA